METITDIRPLIKITPLWLQVFPYILGILIAFLIIYYIVNKFIRIRAVELEKPKTKEHPLNYYQRAMIGVMSARKFMLPGKDKELASQLSDAIRSYLERAYQLPAPEKTTEEFLHKLQEGTLFSGVELETLKEFLIRCDMAKFAKERMSAQEQENLCQLAKRFLELAHQIDTKRPTLEPSTMSTD